MLEFPLWSFFLFSIVLTSWLLSLPFNPLASHIFILILFIDYLFVSFLNKLYMFIFNNFSSSFLMNEEKIHIDQSRRKWLIRARRSFSLRRKFTTFCTLGIEFLSRPGVKWLEDEAPEKDKSDFRWDSVWNGRCKEEHESQNSYHWIASCLRRITKAHIFVSTWDIQEYYGLKRESFSKLSLTQGQR